MMRFEKDIQGGRAFMEFAKVGARLELTRRGFAGRYKTKGCQVAQPWQATESPLIHDGSQNTLSTTQNASSTASLAGPNGSGQFLAVYVSGARTVSLCSTTFTNLSATPFYGILQNKPLAGLAADVGIWGITKAVAGSTAITAGSLVGVSSTSAGVLVPYSSGVTSIGRPVGMALENITGVGQVFTCFIGGVQVSASS